jgi:DNA-binding NarL/FixJ family response regulator
MRHALGLVEAAWSHTAPVAAVNVTGGILSPRETQVATLVARGLHNKEIAAVLGTSPETVRKQTRQIYGKTGTSGRVQLAVLMGGRVVGERDDGLADPPSRPLGG